MVAFKASAQDWSRYIPHGVSFKVLDRSDHGSSVRLNLLVRPPLSLMHVHSIAQISKIIAAKSVDGLAPFSIYSDLVIYIVNAVYHIVSGSPFRCVCRGYMTMYLGMLCTTAS